MAAAEAAYGRRTRGLRPRQRRPMAAERRGIGRSPCAWPPPSPAARELYGAADGPKTLATGEGGSVRWVCSSLGVAPL